MNGRAPALALAALLAASCGDSGPAPAPAADVKGTPFREAAAGAPAPEGPPLGDPDASRPEEAAAAAPAVPVPPPPAKPPEPPAPPKLEDYAPTSFDELAGFECAAYASTEKKEIPAKILALSGKNVVLDGYMMPLQYEAGGAKKFLLMRYKFGCCYAVSPKINEWVEVTMQEGVADYLSDTVTSVWGVLEVKEETREGAAVGLYKMRAVRSEFTEAK